MQVEVLLYLYAFGLGLIFGSFLNVLIVRLPKDEGVVAGRSHCPHCGELIRWYDNIPLLSYLILRGKCRNCRQGIAAQYPLVELFTGLVFAGSLWWYGISVEMAIIDVLIALLIVVTIVDFRHFIIPDLITIPGMVLGLAFSFASPHLSPLQSLVGLLAGGISLYLLALLGDYVFKKESLGGGDIKLAAMLGAWLGWQNLLIVFFVGAFLGLIYALIAMARARDQKSGRLIPFGPFLALAGVFAFFWGERLINWYVTTALGG
jgi:leader peptidase (prepilin peptidase)/N-methyltransferase